MDVSRKENGGPEFNQKADIEEESHRVRQSGTADAATETGIH
jgi:hypothetical protein